MPFNGNGTFVRAFNWVTDKINGVNITASRMDGDSDGFAAGLTNCVTRDGQGKMVAHFTPNANANYDVGADTARWKDGHFNGTVTANDFVMLGGRLLLLSQQSITNSAIPQAISGFGLVPMASASYILEARVLFTVNSTSAPGGIRVGFYASNLNYSSGIITAYGNINAGVVAPVPGGYASLVTNTPSFAFSNAAANGVAGNWIHMIGTLNIIGVTGAPVIGINYCQNTATPGGSLLVEAGSYISLTRVS